MLVVLSYVNFNKLKGGDNIKLAPDFPVYTCTGSYTDINTYIIHIDNA